MKVSCYLAVLLLFLTACKARHASSGLREEVEGSTEAPLVGGDLLMIGGGALAMTGPVLVDRVAKLVGGRDQQVAIISAAARSKEEDLAYPDPSGENHVDANGEWFKSQWVDAGFTRVETVPIDKSRKANTESPEIAARLRTARGFYFSGGDQSRLVDTLYADEKRVARTLVFEAIRDAFTQGAMVAGSSSGTAAQGKVIVTAGRSYESILHPIAEASDKREVSGQLSATNGGLGFFTYGLIDTHVHERGRIGRMVKLAAERGSSAYFQSGEQESTTFVYAIDQKTALLISRSGTEQASMEVVGQLGVTIMEINRLEYLALKEQMNAQGQSDFMIKNVKVTFLTHGDKYQPSTQEVIFASWKKPIAKKNLRKNKDEITTNDIFSTNETDNEKRLPPGEFEKVTTNFFWNVAKETVAESFEKKPTVKVRFRKAEDSQAVAGLSPDAEVKGLKTSFKNLYMDIWVER